MPIVIIRYCALTALSLTLLRIAWSDLRTERIPNRDILIALGMATLLALTGYIPIATALSGFLWLGGITFLIWWIMPLIIGPAIFGGDVKLIALIGLCLGPARGAAILILAGVLQSVIGIAVKILTKKSATPFGPMLVLVTLPVLWGGPAMLSIVDRLWFVIRHLRLF